VFNRKFGPQLCQVNTDQVPHSQSYYEPHIYGSQWTVVGGWFGSHVTESLHKTWEVLLNVHKLLQIVHTLANKALDSVQQKTEKKRVVGTP